MYDAPVSRSRESGPTTWSCASGTLASTRGIAWISCRTPFFSQTVPTKTMRPGTVATSGSGLTRSVSTGFGITSMWRCSSPSSSGWWWRRSRLRRTDARRGGRNASPANRAMAVVACPGSPGRNGGPRAFESLSGSETPWAARQRRSLGPPTGQSDAFGERSAARPEREVRSERIRAWESCPGADAALQPPHRPPLQAQRRRRSR